MARESGFKSCWLRCLAYGCCWATWLVVACTSRQAWPSPASSLHALSHYFEGAQRVSAERSTTTFLANGIPRGDRAVVSRLLDRVHVRYHFLGDAAVIELPRNVAPATIAQLLSSSHPKLRSFNAGLFVRGQLSFYDDHVVAKLKPGKSTDEFEHFVVDHGGRILHRLPIGPSYYYVAAVERGEDALDLANTVQEAGWSVVCVPNFGLFGAASAFHRNMTSELEPDDPKFDEQTALRSVAFPPAWAIVTGSKDVAVAVLDGPFDLDHEDLQDNVTRPLDAFRNDDDPEIESEDDFHGTQALGIVGAGTDNGVGVAGATFNTRVIPIKVGIAVDTLFGSGMWTTVEAIVLAAHHAVESDAPGVVAASNSFILGRMPGTAAVEEAFADFARYSRNGKGAALFAGTGNEGVDSADDLPMSIDCVVGVGIIEASGNASGNFGPHLDVLAPDHLPTTGDGSWGDTVRDGYDFMDGTSAASPLASAIAALAASMNPALTGAELTRIVCNSTDLLREDRGSSLVPEMSARAVHILGPWHPRVGYGRVNALNAVRMATRRRIPYCAAPVLYAKCAAAGARLHFLDKDPGRDFPARHEPALCSTQLDLAPIAGERLACVFSMRPTPLLYRIGSGEEIIERIDPATGIVMSVCHRAAINEVPSQVLVFTSPNAQATAQADWLLVKYFKDSGREEIYRVTYVPLRVVSVPPTLHFEAGRLVGDPQSFRVESGIVDVIPQSSVQGTAGADLRYASVEMDDRAVVVRLDVATGLTDLRELTDSLDLVLLGSFEFDLAEPPDLVAAYRTSSNDELFVYAQVDGHEYSVARVKRDGQVLHQTVSDNFFGETLADGVAVHAVYDDDHPLLIFWQRNGAVRMKQVTDGETIGPFVLTVGDLTPPLPDGPRVSDPDWFSTCFVPFP